MTPSITSSVRSSDAPAGSSALTKKYPSSSPGTNPLGTALNDSAMATTMPPKASIMRLGRFRPPFTRPMYFSVMASNFSLNHRKNRPFSPASADGLSSRPQSAGLRVNALTEDSSVATEMVAANWR